MACSSLLCGGDYSTALVVTMPCGSFRARAPCPLYCANCTIASGVALMCLRLWALPALRPPCVDGCPFAPGVTMVRKQLWDIREPPLLCHSIFAAPGEIETCYQRRPREPIPACRSGSFVSLGIRS
eukprot:304303-Pleurochrysis_carterae.AAC.3